MNTLIIYDETGYIIYQATGNVREPVGIPFMWVEIPEGKRIVSIDASTETHAPVFEDSTKTEVQLLQEQVNDLNIAMAALMGGAV